MKKILITGKDSYIGSSFEKWVSQWPDKYQVTTIDVRDESWKLHDFSNYDAVLHVAAIVHKNEKNINETSYKKVNTILPIEIAKKAKENKIGQFIFLSSISVYGLKKGEISRQTITNPKTKYAESKLNAEIGLSLLEDSEFNLLVLRVPLVYGYKSRGNFQKLINYTIRLPLITGINNKRSMIYIENLSNFIKLSIDLDIKGLKHPQNSYYSSTDDIISSTCQILEKKPIKIFLFKPFILFVSIFISPLTKVFQSLIIKTGELPGYISKDGKQINYSCVGFHDSIKHSIKGDKK